MSLSSSSFLPGEPRGGRGSMSGVINGQEFGEATLNATVLQEAHSGLTTFQGSIDHIPASVGEWGPSSGLELEQAGRASQGCPGPDSQGTAGSLQGLGPSQSGPKGGHFLPALHPQIKQKDCIEKQAKSM